MHVGLWVGNIIWTLRASLGDFGMIDAGKKLDSSQNYLFWVGFLITTFFGCVIFLNFIVAEASASYTAVTEILEQVIWQGQADLLSEAETMTWDQYQNNDKFNQIISE